MSKFSNIKNQLETEMQMNMNEAWEFFKQKEKLPKNMTRVQFYNLYQNTELDEKWGAFRHVYTSAEFTRKHGIHVTKLLGDLNELKQLGAVNLIKEDEYKQGNVPKDRYMDLKNNSVGRNIGLWSFNEKNLLEKVYSELGKNKKIIMNQNQWNNFPYTENNNIMNLIWRLMDLGAKNQNSINSMIKKFSGDNIHTGQAANLDNDYDFDEKPRELSFREKLIREREERLARYKQRLAESPEKIAEQEANHVSLEELIIPQEARRQRIHDVVQGTVQFDENADYSSYENKKSGDNKIFTQEEIDEMSDEDREKNKEAIFYQKQTIGLPTKEQAEKSASKGGMVYVNSYVRKDGTKVKAYYRSR